MNFFQYEALAHLVKYGNLYQLRVIDWAAKTEETHEYWRSQDPEDPGDHLKLIQTKDVEWLLKNYLARPVDFDPLLVRGKIVPTDKARERLKNHGMTPETEGVGVHLSHCCLKVHGCKYGHEFCPVVIKMFPPDSDKCGACYESEQWRDEELAGYESDELIQELESRGYTVVEKERE